jgi:diguanylate cyclase (GGDEF)-like protein
LLEPEDYAARLGGDEFVLLAKHVSIIEYATEMAARILRDLREPTQIDGHVLTFGVSIGIAVANGNPPEALLLSADQALYRAKRSGKNRFVVSQ